MKLATIRISLDIEAEIPQWIPSHLWELYSREVYFRVFEEKMSLEMAEAFAEDVIRRKNLEESAGKIGMSDRFH